MGFEFEYLNIGIIFTYDGIIYLTNDNEFYKVGVEENFLKQNWQP